MLRFDTAPFGTSILFLVEWEGISFPQFHFLEQIVKCSRRCPLCCALRTQLGHRARSVHASIADIPQHLAIPALCHKRKPSSDLSSARSPLKGGHWGWGPWAGPQRAEPDATSQHHLDAADLWAHRAGGFKKLSLGLIRHITSAGPPLARINLSLRLGARSKSISNGGR